MQRILFLLLLFAFASASGRSGEGEIVDGSFKAAGNCGMCKTRIEKALGIEGVTAARWNKRNGRVTVEFQSPPLTLDSLQKRVAAAGHDTENYRAPDSVYADLPACCLYRDMKKRH